MRIIVVLRRHQRYIGKVKHAVFHTQKTGRKRVIVSTEENVVASLDLRHGEICMNYSSSYFCYPSLNLEVSSTLIVVFLTLYSGLVQFGDMFSGQRTLSMGLVLPWENVRIIFYTCGSIMSGCT